jgi:hypothetical protein
MWKCTLYPCLYQYIFYLTKFMHTCSFCFIAACFYSRVSVLSGLFYQDVLCWLLRDYSTMYTQTIPYNLHCLYYVCVHPCLSYCYLFSMFCCDEIANLLDWVIWNDHTHTVVVRQKWCIVLGRRLLCLNDLCIPCDGLIWGFTFCRYRDPKTGLPYATMAAFKIIRERYILLLSLEPISFSGWICCLSELVLSYLSVDM